MLEVPLPVDLHHLLDAGLLRTEDGIARMRVGVNAKHNDRHMRLF